MDWLLTFWRNLWTSKRVAVLEAENMRLVETNFALEDENDQLKKELRAAVNNLLSNAGVAPLPPHEEVKAPQRQMKHRRLSLQQRQRLYAQLTAPKEKRDV